MTTQNRIGFAIALLTGLAVMKGSYAAEVPPSAAGKRWPVAATITDSPGESGYLYTITQGYNQQSSLTGVTKLHDGIDLAWNGAAVDGCGKSIYPIASGTIVEGRSAQINCADVPACSTSDLDGEATVDACNRKRRRNQCGGGWGNYAMIHHQALGVYCTYAHLQNRAVSDGQVVSVTDSLGGMGNTGFSTGCHLHLRCSTQQEVGIGYYAGALPADVRNPAELITNASGVLSVTPATTSTHFCNDAAVSSGAPNHTFSCTRVTDVMPDGATPVVEEGNLVQLNAHYTDVYGSGVSLRVYVDRDGQRFTFENVFVQGQAVSSTLEHDEGPHNYTADPHTAYVLPRITNVRRASGASSSTLRFYLCLDRAGESTDYATCKASPDFDPAPSIVIVGAGSPFTTAMVTPDAGVIDSGSSSSGGSGGSSGSNPGGEVPEYTISSNGNPQVCLDKPRSSSTDSCTLYGQYTCTQARTTFTTTERIHTLFSVGSVHQDIKVDTQLRCNGTVVATRVGEWHRKTNWNGETINEVTSFEPGEGTGSCSVEFSVQTRTTASQLEASYPITITQASSGQISSIPGQEGANTGLVSDRSTIAANCSLRTQGLWYGDMAFTTQTAIGPDNTNTNVITFPSGQQINTFLRHPIGPTTDGTIRISMKAHQSGARGGIQIGGNLGTNEINVGFLENNSISYYNGTNWVPILTTYQADTWYTLDVEYQSSNSTVRYRLDNGTWTTWDYSISAWTTLTTLSLNSNGAVSGATAGAFTWTGFSIGASTTQTTPTNTTTQTTPTCSGLTETFATYTANTALAGQGSWYGDARFAVSTDQGSPVITFPSGHRVNVFVRKDISSTTDGMQTVYLRAGQTTTVGGIQFGSNVNTNEMNVAFQPDGTLSAYNGTRWVPLITAQANTWYKLDSQWQSSDSTFRFRVDDGSWSPWMPSINSWSSIENVALNSNGVSRGGGTFSWKDFQQGCTQ